MKNLILNYGLIIVSALADSYAAFIVKMQFNKLGKMDFSSFGGFLNYLGNFFKSPLLITAVIAFVLAPGLWFIALNKIQLSIGYPMLVGFHLLFILVFGLFFLGEGMTINKAIGCILILVSLYFFTRE